MASKGDKAIVDNTFRKKIDREAYEKRAAEKEQQELEDEQREETPMDAKRRRRWERDPLHQGTIVERSLLKGRNYGLDLTAKLGVSQIINTQMPLNQQAGYYCPVCDCSLRDSQSYLDHVNGKWHNRAQGMSMRVERSSLESIQKRLQMHKKRKEGGVQEEYVPDGYEAEAIKEKEKQQKKKKKGENREEDLQLVDPEMMAMMGMSGFGGSKKS